MDILFGILYTVAILSFLVIIHELGHFFMAKWAGIVTQEFGVGYPPLAKKLFHWWGTDFTLNWIPFGGFVRMQGEDAEAGHKEKPGDFAHASIFKRLVVILAGVFTNFVFGVLAFTGLFSVYGIPHPVDDARIEYVAPGSPAEEVGLQVGSSIRALVVDEVLVPISTAEEAITIIGEQRGNKIDIEAIVPCAKNCGPNQITEEIIYQDVYIRSEAETPDGSGALGISFQTVEAVFYPWWQMPIKATQFGFQEAISLAVLILQTLSNLVTNLFTGGGVAQEVSGPIGITGQVVEMQLYDQGIMGAVWFAGLISVNLAIMNLLPLLPLDGGKAVTTLLELVLKKGYIRKIEMILGQAGYVLFVGLLILISIRDVLKLFAQ